MTSGDGVENVIYKPPSVYPIHVVVLYIGYTFPLVACRGLYIWHRHSRIRVNPGDSKGRFTRALPVTKWRVGAW